MEMHLQESTRCCQPWLLCRAGGSRVQARPTWDQPSPKGGNPISRKGILLQVLGKDEVQEQQFQRWISSHRQ